MTKGDTEPFQLKTQSSAVRAHGHLTPQYLTGRTDRLADPHFHSGPWFLLSPGTCLRSHTLVLPLPCWGLE